MTQLDLPPISFARYLDLLKRRRWQVLPVSVLGLFVGAVVALLIPRYYVCQTTVQFSGGGGGTARDPMAHMVQSARVSMRYSVGAALEELMWPEALTDDVAAKSEFVAGVRDRVDFHDLDPNQGRETAHVRILYKDTDPIRAKELTNKLRDVWIEKEQRGMRERADAAITEINSMIDLAIQTRDTATVDLASYAKTYGLNPLDLVPRRDGVLDSRSVELGNVSKQIADILSVRDGMRAELVVRQDQLGKTPKKKTVTAPVVLPPGFQEQIQAKTLKLLYVTEVLNRMSESHQYYGLRKREQARLQEEIAALNEAAGATPDEREIDNPAYAALIAVIDNLTAKIKTADSSVGPLTARRQVLQSEISALADKVNDYRMLEAARDQAQGKVDTLVAEQQVLEGERRVLLQSEPYVVKEYAVVPPRPTDPNITLVALAGCAVGLAFAIGLVLLIDIMQTTFKTLQDVERLLSLPVLGGMSHLLTADRKREVYARRTKTGLAAGVFLLLMISLITIYYVDATRLPPMVRDTLGLILGGPSPDAAPK